jgi:hypothetical protein
MGHTGTPTGDAAESRSSTRGGSVRELVWRKSSKSQDKQCVEIAHDQGSVLVRNSKQPSGPVLTFPGDAFAAFIKRVNASTSES